MTTNNKATSPSRNVAPLALHIRRLRQFYGSEGISQTELAQLLSISNRRLHDYETRRSLPHTVKVLVALSLAFGVSIECLIDPRHLEEIRIKVEHHREKLVAENNRLASAQGGRRSYAC